MNAERQPTFISPEEYRDSEEHSTIKHEFWNGSIVAMAGGTDNHSILCGNVFASAKNALKGKHCRARSSEKSVRMESANAEFYPDALIFCPPGQFVGKGDRTLLNPKVIFEVLSESTEKTDRGSKFRCYRACEFISDYVLISQDCVLVEHFRRVEEGWLLRSFNSLEDYLQFPDLDISLPLSEIYDELELPSALLLFDELSQTFEE